MTRATVPIFNREEAISRLAASLEANAGNPEAPGFYSKVIDLLLGEPDMALLLSGGNGPPPPPPPPPPRPGGDLPGGGG